jgi:hypothetical protein
MDGSCGQHLDAIHSHIAGTTSMSHTGKDYHRKTGNLLKRLFVPSLVAMEYLNQALALSLKLYLSFSFLFI